MQQFDHRRRWEGSPRYKQKQVVEAKESKLVQEKSMILSLNSEQFENVRDRVCQKSWQANLVRSQDWGFPTQCPSEGKGASLGCEQERHAPLRNDEGGVKWKCLRVSE